MNSLASISIENDLTVKKWNEVLSNDGDIEWYCWYKVVWLPVSIGTQPIPGVIYRRAIDIRSF